MAAISTITLCLRAARSLASSAQSGLGLTGADANPTPSVRQTTPIQAIPDHLTSHATLATTVTIGQSGPAHLRFFLRSTSKLTEWAAASVLQPIIVSISISRTLINANSPASSYKTRKSSHIQPGYIGSIAILNNLS